MLALAVSSERSTLIRGRSLPYTDPFAHHYEEYKVNGFKVKHLGDCHCELYDRPEGFSSEPLMCKR